MAAVNPDPTTELCALGVTELARLYRKRVLSPVEVVRATLERIDRLNPTLNAFISVTADTALSAAEAAELQLTSHIDLGPLQGVPFSVKDVIRVTETRTTAASRHLLDAPLDEEDATVVRRLRSAGAILVGKTNLHEFAFGAPDPAGPFGEVQNPRKVGHQAGSSSSGSAAAVGSGMGVLSIGTDTGGSIRNPASVCGVVGLKPTYGLVSARGVIPLSVHLDVVGPLGRSVSDVAAGIAAIGGYDPADPYSALARHGDYLGSVGRDVRGLRLGMPTNDYCRFGQPEALALGDRARQILIELGLVPVPLELPGLEQANDICTTIIAVELWTYHERHRGRQELYGRNFRERAAPGLDVAGVNYAQARLAQEDLQRRWFALFNYVDLLVLPGNLAGAPVHGQESLEVDGTAYPVRSVISRYNRVSNLTGCPSLSLPVGETSDGLPIAIQLVGPPLGDARILAVGHALEQALGNLPVRWGIGS